MNNNQQNFNINPQVNNSLNQNPPMQPNNQNKFFNNSPVSNTSVQTPQMQPTTTINVIPTLGEVAQPNLMDELINSDKQNEISTNQSINQPVNINSVTTNIITNIKPQNSNNMNQPNTVSPKEIKHDGYSLVNDEIKLESTNEFINTEINENNRIEKLNINEEFNSMSNKYLNDTTVQKNIETAKKKNTITITSEMKVFLIIFIVLLLFIFVMPTIFDFLRTL